MHGTILKNLVSFTGLVLDTPTSLPHLLNLNGIATTPRVVLQGNVDGTAGGFVVTVDATNITVTRTTSSSGDAVEVYVECWHTIEEVLPPGGVATPFVASSGGGGGGAGRLPVIFDDAVLGDDSNIRGNRLVNQSPIDDTQTGITNFGSRTDASLGATGQASTIGGGLNNTASGPSSTVPGGSGNVASGANALAEGASTTSSGQNAHSEGVGTQATSNAAHAEGSFTLASGGLGAHAEGVQTVSSNAAAHAEGLLSQATAQGAHAEGSSTQATNDSAHAEGDSTISSGAAAHAEGDESVASGDISHAQGLAATATRFAQHAMGSGQPYAGTGQTSWVGMKGTTPGVAPAETVELLIGLAAGQLVLENGKAYVFRVTATVGGTQAGPVRKQRSLEITFGARRDGGTTVITGSGTPVSFGDAAASTWLITTSVGVAPDRVVLTFTTGAGANSACHVEAAAWFTEVSY